MGRINNYWGHRRQCNTTNH